MLVYRVVSHYEIPRQLGEKPFMTVTEYGKAVRLARQEKNETLSTMSEHLGKSISFLSAIEKGKTKIPLDFVDEVEYYFNQKGYHFYQSLKVLASVDNQNVRIDGLPYQQQLMVASIAYSEYTQEEMQKITALLDEIKLAKL